MNDPRFEVYPRRSQPVGGVGGPPALTGYGWRFRAANGQITAIGGEGFTRREDAHRAVARFVEVLEDSFLDHGDVELQVPAAVDVSEVEEN